MLFLRGSEITSASRPKGRLPRESDPENERAGAVEEVGGNVGPPPRESDEDLMWMCLYCSEVDLHALRPSKPANQPTKSTSQPKPNHPGNHQAQPASQPAQPAQPFKQAITQPQNPTTQPANSKNQPASKPNHPASQLQKLKPSTRNKKTVNGKPIGFYSREGVYRY